MKFTPKLKSAETPKGRNQAALKNISFIRCAQNMLSGAELCSALCSAASENLAAVSGGHSLAEAVLFLALALLRLVGTKHNLLHSFQA